MSNENNIPVYPFKGIDFTAEEINALLRSIPNKLDRDLVRDGKSAYEVAVQNGYTGTVTEWLQSLRGQKGDALTYSDLTDEQKQELKQPAIEAGNEVREQSSSVLKSNTQKTEQFITKAQNTLDSLETEIRKQSSSILASNTEKTNDLIEKSEETVSDLQKTIIDKADGILNANTQKTNQFITKAQNTLDSLETEIREQSNSVLESNSEKTNEFIKASETALDNAEKASEQAIENSKTHWLPTLDSQGNLSWSRSSSTVAPATKNIKGPQGNSGVSGSTDNIEVVNDLNGGESSPERIKVLSAEQGKVLNNKYSEVDKKINEFNISRLYSTNGTGGTNKYTLETAIAQVPAEYRSIRGLKITFINNATEKTETWVYDGDIFTTVSNWKLSNDSDKLNGVENNTQYVKCTTSASIVNKTIYLKGFILSKGIRMLIKFAEINTAENATLNITDTGDKPIYYNGDIVSSTNTWEAGDILDVYYDGTIYQASIHKSYYGNISVEYVTNKQVTRRQIPKAFRKEGLQITYEDPIDGYVTETYVGKNPKVSSDFENDSNWERMPKDKTIQGIVDIAKKEILDSVSVIERELIIEKTVTTPGFNRITLDNPIPANKVFLLQVKGIPVGGKVDVKYEDEDGSTIVFNRITEDKIAFAESDKDVKSLVFQLFDEGGNVSLLVNYPSDYDLEVLRSQTSDRNSEDYIRLRNLVREREKSTYNIYNIEDYTAGYIDINTGKPVSGGSVGYSSMICVYEAKFLNTYSLAGNVQYMMYDKDENYLGYKQINTAGKWVKNELLENTAFMRFSGMNNTNQKIQIYVYVDCLETRKIPYGVSHKQAIINSFLLAPIVELWGDSLAAVAIGNKMKELLGIEVINHSFGGTFSGFIRQRFIEAQENLQAPHIFWIGTNNQYAPYKVVDDVRRMVRELGHNKFLVLTPLPGSQNSLESVQKVLEAEKMLEEAFGTRCLNIRKAFIGLYDMGNVQLKDGTRFLQPDLNGTIDVQLANPTDVHFLKYINSSYRNDENRNYILMDIYGSGTKIDDLCKYEIVYPYTIDSEGGYTKAEGDTDNYEEGIIKLKLLYVPDSISSGDRGSIGYNVENKVVTQTPTGSSTHNTFIDRVRFYKFLDCKCMWEIGGTSPSATSDIIHPYTTNGGDAIGEIIAYKFAELLA